MVRLEEGADPVGIGKHGEGREVPTVEGKRRIQRRDKDLERVENLDFKDKEVGKEKGLP